MLISVNYALKEPPSPDISKIKQESRTFSVPFFDLVGELRQSRVSIHIHGQSIEVSTQYSFRIVKLSELDVQRFEQKGKSHRYFEVLQQPEEFPHSHPVRAEITLIRSCYVLDSIYGDLMKLCWVMVGDVGPSALLVAPASKVLSRCPLPKRLISYGVRLHCVSPDLARKIMAIRDRR